MNVILGLGNPGARYEATRHNIGWMVLDAVAERLGAQFVPAKGDYYEASARWRSRPVVLIKPTTYMNNSGIAARQVLRSHGATPQQMLVIVDELQFPVGEFKLKPSGSHGGHNGLESLIERLQSDQFPRLRCGIGSDFERGGMADYVLSAFASEERALLERMILEARDAALSWIVDGTQQTMNRYNRRRSNDAEASSDANQQQP